MPDETNCRLAEPEALRLYRGTPLPHLGRMAAAVCAQKHPEPCRTYVVDRNINYTNVCVAGCRFCAFHAQPGRPAGWTLSPEQILGEIQELVNVGGTQILIQGGLHPDLPLTWYVGLLGEIKRSFPAIHIHGFSPPEILHLADRSRLGVADLLSRLRRAGLDSLPGGGAEILVDRVRRQISPGKCAADQWLDVMRQAHAIGMRTTATMMFGHVETDAERIVHLRRLRELQDESLTRGAGRFTAFICWTFQPDNTRLAETCRDPSAGQAAGSSLRLAGAHEYLRMLALARLFLDNFDNLQASWVTQGPKIGQLALFFGANDMGSVMMDEKVVAAAGASYRLNEGQIRRLIADAGYQPRRRNCYYDVIEPLPGSGNGAADPIGSSGRQTPK